MWRTWVKNIDVSISAIYQYIELGQKIRNKAEVVITNDTLIMQMWYKG